MVYHIFHAFFFVLVIILFRMRAYGRENIPKNGPAILAPNHVSYLDPQMVGTAIRRKVNYAAKRELFTNPVFGWWLRAVKSFPISRDVMDRQALRSALKFLENGELVLMFPEGTRGDGVELLEPLPGVGMLAYMSKAQVIPVFVKGTEKALNKDTNKLRFKPISIYYGKPANLESYYSKDKYRGIYGDISRVIMEGIQELKDKHG